ncbi:hypothetical protein B1748_29025 [Paenibacillus sp. MY03]|uniref:hypothetical protein n=1 Tax=Paenibacillus sp. MY03 TaxID=302980 RepID=UPI000B3C6AC0|nr:hypothetical protein [Paenibacillus sp. MY03]OUS70281.1 hypothetical protein B1748_29025 [Paenibacillus sp. MY03]
MIKLSIVHGDKRFEMEAAETNDQHVTIALEGAFGIFGIEQARPHQEMKFPVPVVEKPELVVTDLKAKQAREVAAAKSEVVEKPSPVPMPPQVPASILPPSSRPRAVELLGSSRSLQVPIGEVAENPEWWQTGIKYKDGVPHYRTRYYCKNRDCRHKGNQYVSIDAKSTECHQCGTHMKLRTATGLVGSDGIPEIDTFGNFFIADGPMNS